MFEKGKKYLVIVLTVLSVGVVYAASRDALSRSISAGVDSAYTRHTEELTVQVLSLIDKMEQAADKDQMEDVIKYATLVNEKATSLESALAFEQTARGEKDPVAIINGSPTPGWALFRAGFAKDFLVLAKVIKAQMPLPKAIEQYKSLAKTNGVFGYLTGKKSHMSVYVSSIAEAFKRWSGCSEQITAANEQGLIVKSAQDFCNK